MEVFKIAGPPPLPFYVKSLLVHRPFLVSEGVRALHSGYRPGILCLLAIIIHMAIAYLQGFGHLRRAQSFEQQLDYAVPDSGTHVVFSSGDCPLPPGALQINFFEK